MFQRVGTLLFAAAAFGVLASSAPAATPQPRAIAALEREAARGRIDPAVVADLRADGHARAILTVNAGDLIRRAEVGTSRGRGRGGEVLRNLRPALAEAKKRALDRAGSAVDVKRELANLPASVVELDSADAALDILSDARVEGLHENVRSTAEADESMQVIHQPEVAAAGRTGAGTYTLILDTGVSASAFGCTPGTTGCRIASSWDAAPNDGSQDDDGHGTNVAAIAATVAPGTKILAVDVFQRDAQNVNKASVENVLAGINWALNLKRQGYNVTSLNMSLGGPEHYMSTCGDSGYATTFATARSLGVLPVVAAGNAGTVAGRFVAGVAFPACTPGAVSVGATYDGDNGALSFRDCSDATTRLDQITCFSQRGPTLSLFAPGAMITAGGFTMAGTSQAAPHVAGAASVLAAAKPTATVAQIEDALVNSGPMISDSLSGISRHRLDLAAAVNRLLGTTGGRAPVMTAAPLETLQGPVGATVPVSFSYAATDDVAVTRYQPYLRVNNGAWQTINLATPTARSFTVSATPGASYQVAVRALDGSGNASAWSYSQLVRVGLAQESWTGMKFTTGWQAASSSSASGGREYYTSTRNAQVTITFTGRQIAWYGVRATNRGQAWLWADGAYVGYVDAYAGTAQWRSKIYGYRFAKAGTHTLTIRNVATASRPYIDVDAAAVVY